MYSHHNDSIPYSTRVPSARRVRYTAAPPYSAPVQQTPSNNEQPSYAVHPHSMPRQQHQGVPHNISPYATPHAYYHATLGQPMQQTQQMQPYADPVPGANTWQQQHPQLPPQEQQPYLLSRQGVTQAQPQLPFAYANGADDAYYAPVQPPSRRLTADVMQKNSGSRPMKDKKGAPTSKRGPFPLFPLESVDEELARSAYLAMKAILNRDPLVVRELLACEGRYHEQGLFISYFMQAPLVPQGCWVFFGAPGTLNTLHDWLRSPLQEPRKGGKKDDLYTGAKELPPNTYFSPVSQALEDSKLVRIMLQAKGTKKSLQMAESQFKSENRRFVHCGCHRYQIAVVKDENIIFVCFDGNASPASKPAPMWPGRTIQSLRAKRPGADTVT